MSAFQIYFQLEIISFFNSALDCVKHENMKQIMDIGVNMVTYTILSMACMAIISILSTNVAANSAYETRKNIFHILMHLPSEEIGQFKTTGLMSRTTRGLYTEQGFIQILLKRVLLIPFVIIGLAIEISFIDLDFALIFICIVTVLTVLLIFKSRQVIDVYFKAKKTYGNINSLFMKKINEIKNKIRTDHDKESFKESCQDSYKRNITYQLEQYYVTPALFLILDGIIVILLIMMNFGISISFDSISVVDSIVIIQFLLYFITTLTFIPAFMYRLPKAYATSVRVEEVLVLEDKIDEKLEDHKFSFKKIKLKKSDFKFNPKRFNRKERKEALQRFWILLSNYHLKVILSLILLSISTLCIAYAPKVAGNIVNLFAKHGVSRASIINNILFLAVLYIVGYILQTYSNRIMIFLGEKVAYNLRLQMLYDKLTTSEIFSKDSSGNIFSRMNNDLMKVRDFITIHVSDIFAQLLSVVFVIILILTTDWRLSLIYIATLPLYLISFYYYDIKSQESYENHQNLLGKLMQLLNKSITNHSIIQNESQHGC